MRRWLFVGVLIAIVGGIIAVAPVTKASTADFSFSKFEADYYLSKDSSGRSTMKVTEQLTAEFPSYDQNKGIIRAIPLTYDGHPVSLVFDDRSLTRNGAPEPVYEKEKSNGNLDVSTGTEDYVTNSQTYQFTYYLRDVTKDFGDHQELYWDTNGTGWQQSFGSVLARVHLDPSIAAAWTDQIDCYQGVNGANEACSGTESQVDGQTLLTFQSNRVFSAGENLTFVIGFQPNTFAAYQRGPLEYISMVIRILSAVTSAVALVWAIVLKASKGRNAKGRGTIVPEYLPPKDVALLVTSNVGAIKNGKEIAAQIVDLAVRHNIQIIEYNQKQLFGSKKVYKLKFLSDAGMNADELAFAQALFETLVPEAEYDMGDQISLYRIGMAITSFNGKLAQQMVERGYRRKIPGRYAPIFLSVIAMISGVITVAAFQTDASIDLASLVFFIVAIPSLLVTIMLLGSTLPLTDKGVELRDYLKGMEMYIKVAEAERLKILQSVEGAIRQEIGDINDHTQLVKLYERMLPYAILLGVEKSWGKVLEQYYTDQTHPAWYVGVGAFSVDNFTSSLSSFAASTSASSSGLGGGGSSGGGGGGGGGGGR